MRFDLDEDEVIGSLNTLVERFVDFEYAHMNVAGKVVVDIGASIGDSLVYFARQGAIHVYGYEPFRSTFLSAVHNVDVNGHGAVVTIHNLGVSGSSRIANAEYVPRRSPALTTVAELQDIVGPAGSGSFETVELVPLAHVITEVRARHPTARLVCKMDCEGCEFEAFDNCSPEILAAVDEWLIEYHYLQPISLDARLKDAGFVVTLVPQTDQIGYIYANRASKTLSSTRV